MNMDEEEVVQLLGWRVGLQNSWLTDGFMVI